MKKRNNRKKNKIINRLCYLDRRSSRSNIVRIDKFGEDYIVVPSIIDQRLSLNHRVLRFALGNATKEKEVEELLKRNHARGGITYATRRVKINNNDEGVWPPFMPKNIEVVEVKELNIINIKK